ncbi:hypothetical protein Tcan_13052 [Toxocara canis]|uniref:G_PROTEIN_RECEP_F1_2 domain-containing protein n=1 Tax=Toxocara canis TaxID=6265 RepID=A0A0B2UWB6_TOXCA|nr:hypothetical protein Tcan_13052 [Toxocara canis]
MKDLLDVSGRPQSYARSPSAFMAYAFIVESFLIIVFNGFVFGFIMLAPDRRTQRHYCILAGSVVFEFIFACTYFTYGLQLVYVIRNYGAHIPLVSRWECLNKVHSLLLLFITPEAGILSLSIAIDRLLSVFAPVRYILLPPYYPLLLFLCSFLSTAVGFVFTYIANYGTRNLLEVSAECSLAEVVTPNMFKALRYIRIVTSLIGAILYIPVGYRLRQIIKRANRHVALSNIESTKLRQMTLSIGLITLSQLVFFALPDAILLFSSNRYREIVFFLNLNKSVVNLLIIVFTQQELREFLFRKFWKKDQCTIVRFIK